MLHFFLTSAIGHYIAVQIGTQMGQIVAQGLIDSSKTPQEAEANVIYQGIQNNTSDIMEQWKIPLLLISLPVKPLMDPFIQQIRKNQLDMFVSKKISKNQYEKQGLLIDYVVNFINSLSLGFLVFIMLKVPNQYKRKT